LSAVRVSLEADTWTPIEPLTVPEDRVVRILAALSRASGQEATTRLCAVCAEVTRMSGAGIMMLAGDQPRGSICTTDDVSELLEELQYSYGEGPCVDAHRQDRPVAEPDLADPSTVRWPAFAPAAVAAGARAVFGFPIGAGASRFGALNLYRDQPGPLEADQHADALVVAGIAGRAIFAMQADALPGALGHDLDRGANFRFVVHQASGMVAVQLGIAPDDALLRLRAHAFREARTVTEVARDVVDGRLRFDRDGESS
jgi:hypothetical protein